MKTKKKGAKEKSQETHKTEKQDTFSHTEKFHENFKNPANHSI